MARPPGGRAIAFQGRPQAANRSPQEDQVDR